MQRTIKNLIDYRGTNTKQKQLKQEKFIKLKNLSFGQNEKSLNNSDIKSKDPKKMRKIQLKSKVKNSN